MIKGSIDTREWVMGLTPQSDLTIIPMVRITPDVHRHTHVII